MPTTPGPAPRSTVMTLAEGLVDAVVKDQAPTEDGFDLAAGLFGVHVSNWLRTVAAQVDGAEQSKVTAILKGTGPVERQILYATAATIYDAQAGRFTDGPSPFQPSWMAGDALIFALREDRAPELAVAPVVAAAASMSKEMFLKLAEIEISMGKAHAKGEDAYPGFDETFQVFRTLTAASPWTLHPDHGCVLAADVDALDSADERVNPFSTVSGRKLVTNAMKKDYVILVGGGSGPRWLAHDSIEDDGEPATQPPTTTAPEMAMRCADHGDIQKVLRTVVKRYPAHAFRIDVLMPLEAQQSIPQDYPRC